MTPTSAVSAGAPATLGRGPARTSGTPRRPARVVVARAGRADQAADHRTASRHHRPGHAARPARRAVDPARPGHPRRRHAGRGQCQHHQLLHRPRHRRGHEAHLAAPAGGQRPRHHQAVGGSAPGGSCSGRRHPLLGLLANWLAASLADAAILFYIFVYTLLLKRRSPANIVIGGAAGCFPVLVGWAAVTGTVSLPAIVLFAVIFLWTPPHFWALAMKFRKDYAAANVPMLPVVASPAAVARKILGTPTRWWRPRWPRTRTRAGSTACSRLVPGRGAPAERPGGAPGADPPTKAPTARSAPRRCACSTCRSRT